MGSVVSKLRNGKPNTPQILQQSSLFQKLWNKYHMHPKPDSVYAPLDHEKHEFRLLVLHPKITEHEIIICSLCTQYEIANLLESEPATLEYDAFSYVWSRDSSTIAILLNGVLWPISSSLWQMLDYQRSHFDGLFSFLWIDAVCVNQQDLVELGQQVALMGQIYSHANSIIAWLGAPVIMSPDDPMLRALEIIRALGFSRDNNIEDHLSDKQIFREASSEPLCEDLFFHRPFDVARFRVLEHLWCSSLWARTWCVQEIVLGGQTTEFRYGNEAADWTILMGSLIWIDRHRVCCVHRLEIGAEGSLRELASILLTLEQLLGPYLYLSNRRSRKLGDDLLTTMATFRNRSCTRLHDKIYGFLGLCNSTTVAPDYSIPVEQVYRDFAIAQICETGSLDVLLHVTHNHPFIDLPSWTPHWARSPKNETRNLRSLPFCGSEDFEVRACFPSQSGNGHLRDEDLLDGHPSRSFCAAGHSIARLHDLDGWGIALSGFTLDTVEQVFQVVSVNETTTNFRGGSREVSINVEQLELWVQCTTEKSTSGGRYISGGSMEEARVRTMFSDTMTCKFHEGRIRLSPQGARCLAESFELVLEGFREGVPVGLQSERTYATYLFTLANVNQFLFITRQGFLGQTDVGVAIDDTVCILYGGKQPFLLRERELSEKCHAFLGPTYVHGVMDGEFVTIVDHTRAEEFILR